MRTCTLVAFFRASELSNKEGEQVEEYIGVDLAYLQDDESSQEVTDDEDFILRII